MKKRKFIKIITLGLLSLLVPFQVFTKEIKKIIKSNIEWKEILTAEQYYILRQEKTEKPFTSPLNDEKREGEKKLWTTRVTPSSPV